MSTEAFEVHRLNGPGMEKAVAIAEHFTVLFDALEKLVPQGRQLAIVKTKLEEACFFAKKGMATQKENQE